MVAVPFSLSNAPGENAQEGAGRLINCYAEALGKGSRGEAVWKRVPGLTAFSTTVESTFRGGIEISGAIRAIFSGKAISINSSGVESTIAALAGTKRFIVARNNNATPQMVVVGDDGVFEITSTAVNAYPDVDVGSPNSVCFLDGYFFFTRGNGTCIASGLNTTAINALDVITAESNPDGLTRAIPFKSQLLLFGTDSCEFWSGNPVNSTGFPFNRVTSSPYGLKGRYAIAGQEQGFGTDLAWVSKDNGVYLLKNGYIPDKISPPDLDRLIAAVTDTDELEAYCYTTAGRSVWGLSSSTWTWEFNLNTLKWNERQSYLLNRWRGTQTFYAFGKWMTGDTQSGNIYEIDRNALVEAGNPLRVRMESGVVHQFPNRTRIARIDVDVTTGVGDAQGADPIATNPTIEIAVARDCVNFDDPHQVPLGQQSVASQRVMATRFGISGDKGLRIRLDVSDPVHVGILGADVSATLQVK